MVAPTPLDVPLILRAMEQVEVKQLITDIAAVPPHCDCPPTVEATPLAAAVLNACTKMRLVRGPNSPGVAVAVLLQSVLQVALAPEV